MKFDAFIVSCTSMTRTDCTVMMQVEETFMQQVVLHWQGSATAAANTAAMQSDQQSPAYAGPAEPQVGQLDRQGSQIGSQAVDATGPSGGEAETRDPPVAGKRHSGRSSCLLERNLSIAR